MIKNKINKNKSEKRWLTTLSERKWVNMFILYFLSLYLYFVLLIGDYDVTSGISESQTFILAFILDILMTSIFVLLGILGYKLTKNKVTFWIIYGIISFIICLFALSKGLILGGM